MLAHTSTVLHFFDFCLIFFFFPSFFFRFGRSVTCDFRKLRTSTGRRSCGVSEAGTEVGATVRVAASSAAASPMTMLLLFHCDHVGRYPLFRPFDFPLHAAARREGSISAGAS